MGTWRDSRGSSVPKEDLRLLEASWASVSQALGAPAVCQVIQGGAGRGALTLAFPLVAAEPAAPPRTFESVQEHGRRPGHHCDLPGHGGSEDPRATPL